jgi:cellobiose phosphorylase
MAFALLGDHNRAWELLAMINPVNRGGNDQAMAAYKVEPYVVAADVYAVPPHTGRGGWTWYTGSAGWMYQLIVETLLGLTREPERLRLNPRLPRSWTGFKLRYRYRDTFYHLIITRTANGGVRTEVDGVASPDQWIGLVNDAKDHHVNIHVLSRDSDLPSDRRV